MQTYHNEPNLCLDKPCYINQPVLCLFHLCDTYCEMVFLKLIAFILACMTIGNAQDLNLNDIDMRKMVFDMNRKIDSLDKRVEFLEERHKLLETIEKMVQGDSDDNNDILSKIKHFQRNVNEMEIKIQNMEQFIQVLLKKERYSGEFKKTSIENHDVNVALMKESSAGVEDELVKNPSFDVNDSGENTQSQKSNVSSGSMTEQEVGEQHRRSGETPQIAFTVSVSTKQIENLGKHQTIVFDHVITNVGGMYNPLTGIFHVPYSGTYVFSLTFNPGKLMVSETYLEIVQDGAQLADVLVENSARDSAGNYIG
ncbi:uncharacterized protein LOC128241394 [Mya arenaria]|uniref:uncharacterized protein LOC128241394 n=1 Tax=Mya arenaria TaxID=6604 RepID=UPI0022E52068|nr:uncharacterized protein LOC128241394 [Mya arenaria]